MRALKVCAPFVLCGSGSMAAHAQQTITLRDAVTLAQKQGYQAEASRKSRDVARAQDKRFSASLLPQLSLTGNLPVYNRSIIPVLQPDGSTLFRSQQENQSSLQLAVAQQLPFTGGNLFVRSGLSRVERIGSSESRTWSGTPFVIGVTQPIFRANTAAWDARAQNIRADVAERQYLESREDVAIAVTNAFFDFYAAKVTLANALKSAAIYDTLYTLNKGRYEVGKIGQTDLEQGHLQYLRAQSSVDGAKLEYERTLAVLRIQLHLPAGTPLDVTVSNDIPRVTADTSVAVTQALRNSSSPLTLELQDVDARRRISEAKRNTGPGATLQASVGYNQTGLDAGSIYRDPLQAQQFSLSVSMPIYQFGARGAQIDAAKFDQERIATTAKQTREQTIMDAHFAALQLEQSRRNFELAVEQDTVGAHLFEVAQQRYAISRITLQDLLNAQTSKDQAVTSYLQALRGYWVAYYRLRRLTLFDFEAGQAIR
jgi:outer membrane protein TolC